MILCYISLKVCFFIIEQGLSAITFFALVAAVTAQAQYQAAPAAQPYREPEAGPAVYNFNWLVKDDPSNNNYGQTEDRNGDKTSGSYYVSLPDGRLQKVTYSVDGQGGYRADVTYEGTASYPAQQPQAYSRPAAPAPVAPARAPAAPAPAAPVVKEPDVVEEQKELETKEDEEDEEELC